MKKATACTAYCLEMPPYIKTIKSGLLEIIGECKGVLHVSGLQ